MGLFDSFRDQKPSSQVSNVALRETIPVIQAARNVNDVRKSIEKFGDINHPSIQYSIAVTCLMHGMTTESKMYYLLGANHGLSPDNEYYNTPHADAIGQCLTHLLTQFSLSGASKAIEQATTLAYIYLSKCISMFGPKAYDSRRTRSILIEDHESPHAISSFILMNFEGTFKEILIIADLVKSASSYAPINPEIAKENLARATRIHHSLSDMAVAGIDADDYSVEEIAEIGDRRHQIAFHKLDANYKIGVYSLSQADLSKVLA